MQLISAISLSLGVIISAQQIEHHEVQSYHDRLASVFGCSDGFVLDQSNPERCVRILCTKTYRANEKIKTHR